MSTKDKCNRCGTTLPADWPKGLCQQCALAAALEAAVGDSQLLPLGEPSSENGSPSGASHPSALAQAARPHNDSGGNEPVFGGRPFGNYELIEEIARGGMGVVYKARQPSLNRLVALKVILSGQFASKQEVLRFRGEAEAAAHLRHPNIVAIYETGEHEGQHFFSMDYVPGRTLADIARDGPLPPQRAGRYVRFVAEAIHYAHQKGILHRDLKPSNVLIDADDQPRVTDFGLAKRLRGDFGVTVTGQMLGSPNFMPPEQTSGKRSKAGPPADVYGLGAILYYLLTGRPPFQAETIEEVIKQLHERDPVPPRLLNASVPRDLETICLKCLEKTPEKRYATALELADELGRFQRDEPIVARPVGRPQKVWRWCRRKPLLASLLVLVHLIGAAGLAGILWQWRRAEHHRLELDQDLYVSNIHLAIEALEESDLARTRLLLRNIEQSPIQRALRGWEWRYLAARSRGDELVTLGRHAAGLAGLSASPDGKWLATISEDGQVKLWDFANRNEIKSWSAHASTATSRPAFIGHSLVFTSDGTSLITCGPDRRICVWALPSGTKRAEVKCPTNTPSRLAISRDGQLLASGTGDGWVTLWGLSNNRPTLLHQWATHISVLFGLVFSRDRTMLLVAGPAAQPVQRYDISAPSDPRRLSDLENSDAPMAVSPDGKWLATAGADEQTLRLWALPLPKSSVETNAVRGSMMTALEFSPDSRVLAAGFKDGRLVLWDMGELTHSVTLLGHQEAVMQLAFSPDGRTLASASYDKTVRLWDVAGAEKEKWSFHHGGRVHAVNFSRDSKRLISAALTTEVSGTNVLERRCIARLWDVDERVGLVPVAIVTNRVNELNFSACFSTDGNLVAVDDSKTLQFLQVPTLTPLGQAGQRLPCFATNGSWLAYVEDNKILRASSPLSPSTVLGQQRGPITTLALSRDGGVLASCDLEDYIIHLWEAQDGHPLGQLAGHEAWVSCLAFSPDGQTLASAGWDDGWLGIWDVPGQRCRAMLRAHNGAVFKVAFAPDGRTVATCGDDNTVRLWNVARLQEVAVLHGHRGPVKDVAFSPDGLWLASASDDGTIRLWRAPSLAEIAQSPGSRRAGGE